MRIFDYGNGKIKYEAKVISDKIFNPYSCNYYEESIELFCPYCAQLYSWEECNIIFKKDEDEKYEFRRWRIIQCKTCHKKFEGVGSDEISDTFTGEKIEDRIDITEICPKCEYESNRQWNNEQSGYICPSCGYLEEDKPTAKKFIDCTTLAEIIEKKKLDQIELDKKIKKMIKEMN